MGEGCGVQSRKAITEEQEENVKGKVKKAEVIPIGVRKQNLLDNPVVYKGAPMGNKNAAGPHDMGGSGSDSGSGGGSSNGTSPKEIAAATSNVGAILKGPEFRMSEEGGNGKAFVKNGEIVLRESTWIESNKVPSKLTPEAWKPGGSYHEYFKTEHGIITEPVPQSNGFNYTRGDRNFSGYNEIRVKVVSSGQGKDAKKSEFDETSQFPELSQLIAKNDEALGITTKTVSA